MIVAVPSRSGDFLIGNFDESSPSSVDVGFFECSAEQEDKVLQEAELNDVWVVT